MEFTWERRKGIRGFDLEHDHASYDGESCEHDVVNRRNNRCVECIQCLCQYKGETQKQMSTNEYERRYR